MLANNLCWACRIKELKRGFYEKEKVCYGTETNG